MTGVKLSTVFAYEIKTFIIISDDEKLLVPKIILCSRIDFKKQTFHAICWVKLENLP